MNILKYRNFFFAFSLFFLIPGSIFLLTFGLKPSIDFIGGSVLELEFSREKSPEVAELSPDELKNTLLESTKELYVVTDIKLNQENRIILEGNDITNEIKTLVLESLGQKLTDVRELRFESIGPTLSKELLVKTLTALVIVAGVIMTYVWYQFDELKYGVCAILAMLHDSIIVLGAFSVLGFFYGVQVDVLFITALLTTLSFSVHDTIVVYDRIRELKRKRAFADYHEIVNTAVVETLSRSINNSVTIIVMLLALSLLGGESVRWFSVALLIGAITGTYSSTFTAAPLLLLWDEVATKKKKRK